MSFPRSDRLLGALLLGLALLAILLWIPLDTETGVIEKVRRRLVIGDALAPMTAMVMFGLSALWLTIRSEGVMHEFGVREARFTMSMILFLLTVFILIRWSGPGVISLANHLEITALEYRSLRVTPPVSYIGLLSGGTVLIAGLSWYADGRLGWRRIALSFTISVSLAILFDLPFEDILLPPNGDV